MDLDAMDLDPDTRARYEAALARLESRADALEARLARFGRYALALERDGLEFLMDPRLFWGPPRVLVRRGRDTLEVWLDRDYVSVRTNCGFSELDERRALRLVRESLEDLLDSWFRFRDDWKRDRLERNPMVY